MMKYLIALMLCCSYLVRDGVLAQWSWDETIHHASLEHEHHDDSHSDEEHDHRNDDCCLTVHSLVLKTKSFVFITFEHLQDQHFPAPHLALPTNDNAPLLRPPIV